MAITANAITNSFKEDLLQGTQVFAAGAGNTFNLALYTSAATIGADTTSYAVGIAGQVGDTGTYAAGGGALVTALVSVNGTTAFVDFDDLSFTGVTLTAAGALIYNDTQAGDPSVCVLDFGGDKTATSGTFTIQFPAANDTQAIIRIS
jgi:hypothetical protein